MTRLSCADAGRTIRLVGFAALAMLAVHTAPAAEAPAWRAITPTLPDKTVTLTGHDLTFDQVVAVARQGEAVELSPEALRHQEDTYKLLLEAAAEGLPVAGFNRGSEGTTPVFDGDPAAPEIAAATSARLLEILAAGASPPGAPEIAEEETVRAVMVVRANTLLYSPASPPVAGMLLAFLNDRITPVAAPGGVLKAIGAAMVGKGDVYYRGRRMPAAQALTDAGLMPLAPSGMDDHALIDSGAELVARAAILAADGAHALDWADVIYAMALDGADANVAPFSLPAQANRPFQWLNWEAFRVLDMLKGSYLLADDPGRLSALPEPLRTLPGHQGAAWMAWGTLRDTVLVALNASDQPLALRVDLSPRESPELAAAQIKKFYVRGGRANGNHRGYVVETVNDDLSPITVPVAGFAFALESLDAVLGQGSGRPRGPDGSGSAADRARKSLDDTLRLLSLDLLAAAASIDQRMAEDPARALGTVPTAVMTELRKAVPAGTESAAIRAAAYEFLARDPIAAFVGSAQPAPGSDEPIPLAQERISR